jgi:hypothetical protein
MRLGRPAVRKGSAFPAQLAQFLPPPRRLPRFIGASGAEKVGRCFPATERQSLSAQQAAKPQVIGQRRDRNLDKLGSRTARQKTRAIVVEFRSGRGAGYIGKLSEVAACSRGQSSSGREFFWEWPSYNSFALDKASAAACRIQIEYVRLPLGYRA